jgi:hypothetical protein
MELLKTRSLATLAAAECPLSNVGIMIADMAVCISEKHMFSV